MTFRTTTRTRIRRAAIAMTTTVATLAMLLLGAAPAQAVGPAILSVEITPVDAATGQPVTTAGFGQNDNRLAYRIGYSCSVAECTDTVVTLPAIETDPTHGVFRLHDYETWTPPAGGGASIVNNVATGTTVTLGTLAAGTSATFQVQYVRATDTSAPGPVPASYFPPGYQIQRSATIASPNAVASATAAATPVTWQITVPTPSIVKTAPATVQPDTDVTYSIAMSDGCFEDRGQNRWTASGRYLCAESFTVVDELPAQAVFVAASNGGVYDAASNTVTWTGSGTTAAGGWGVAGFNWTQRFGYNPRTITVRYPASAFPEGADGADFVVPVTNDADVSVTYLDDAATVKTAAATYTHQVARVAPYGRADQLKVGSADQDIQGSRFVNVPPATTGMVCPPGGRDDWNRVCAPGQPLAPFATRTDQFWRVDTANRANVPGIATVVDDDLGNSSVRVRRITTTGGDTAPTIVWRATDGTTPQSGMTTTLRSFTAPPGTWFTGVTITSGLLAGPNQLPSSNAATLFRVDFGYDIPVGSPLFTWRNSASATMTYPGQPQIAPIALTSNAAVIFRETPRVNAAQPAFTAGFSGAPVVEGGGQVVPGGRVTFGVRGATANIPADRDVSPQYVFIAPAGWTIVPNSATFPAGSVPAGASFTYKTVTIAGVSRQAVLATWPSGATFGKNATWPTMSVIASPTAAVTAGTSSVAATWVGDSRNAYDPSTTTYTTRVVDTTDIDGDGITTEAFASANSAGVTVGATSRLDVLKEICVETDDGACDWVSDPDVIAGVSPDATDISYRVSLVNGGNSPLTGVVGYDVLPWIGDTRGSTFAEQLNTITSQSANLSLTFSGSTNPCRPEVRPTNPGCAAGWTAPESGAAAIRAAVTGSLAPGASATFQFDAGVVAGAPADAIACNSVAVDSANTLPSEPRPVCATTQEADLAISVPDRLPLQAGRLGIVPFTVTNLGPSANAPATVDIQIPAGIRITSLTPAGWICTAATTAPDGSVLGPVALSCDPVAEDGSSRMLALDAPNALDLPAVVPDDTLVGGTTCFAAEVSGFMADPVEANDTDSACFAVLQGAALLGLTKDDGRDSLEIGEVFTYTIEVSNLLAGEALSDVVITDELPATLSFVSATGGGTVTGQGDPDAGGLRAGGTVTWTLDELAAAGIVGDGTGVGEAESTRQLSVGVRVVQAAETTDSISNTATVAAADPASPDSTLTASDTDTDALVRTASLSLVKSAAPTIASAAGDDVSYSFLVTNTGDVTLTAVQIAETEFTGSGDLAVTCPAGAATLAPGASVTCTASYELTQADVDAGGVDNTATASATAPSGLTAPVSAASTATVAVAADPSVELIKTVSPTAATLAGETVTYSFEVENTGNVTLFDATIDEVAFSGAGADVVPVCAEGALAPGDSITCTATYTLVQADIDAGTVTNTATATMLTGADVEVDSEESVATVTIASAPAISLEKTVAPTTGTVAGDEVTYSFEIANTGNVTLDAAEIQEVDFSGAGEDVVPVCAADAVAPGDSITCTAVYELLQDDIDAGTVTNTATATMLTAGDAEVASEESTATVTIAAAPAVTLEKTVTPATGAAAGDVVTYSFEITNSGNVTLTGAQVQESSFTGAGDGVVPACTAGELAPGDSTTCTATYELVQADVEAAQVSNTATASMVAPGGAVVSSAASTAVVTIPAAPAISLVKSVGPNVISEAGDVVTYLFAVENTGNVILTGAQIQETAFSGTGAAVVPVCETGSFGPGDTIECTATYAVTQADVNAGEVVNTATATAVPTAGGAAVASGSSTATVQMEAAPGLEVVKSATPTDLIVDQEVTYSFVVTNTGNVTLEDIGIDEVEFTGTGTLSAVDCGDAAAALDPDEQLVCEATYVITQADVDAGELSNTATATGTGPGGPFTSESSSVALPFDRVPGLELEKTADVAGFEAAGDVIDYRFRVTNTGNVTMTDITVVEGEFTGTGELSAIDCDLASLLPGQRADCVASYAVTQEDVDAGGVDNTATATGDAPGDGGLTVTDPSSVSVPFVGELALGLVKSGTPVDADGDGRTTVRDRIQWSFAVTNLSSATLTQVAVSDPMAGEIVCAATVLAPGATVQCEAVEEYQITAEQAAAGSVLNVASASAFGVAGVTVSSAEASAAVDIVEYVAPAGTPGGSTGGGLANSGSEPGLPLLGALLVLLLGAGILTVRRRRAEDAS